VENTTWIRKNTTMIYEKILLKVVKILLEYEQNTTLKIIKDTTLKIIKKYYSSMHLPSISEIAFTVRTQARG
jgi:hypothetical protein